MYIVLYHIILFCIVLYLLHIYIYMYYIYINMYYIYIYIYIYITETVFREALKLLREASRSAILEAPRKPRRSAEALEERMATKLNRRLN